MGGTGLVLGLIVLGLMSVPIGDRLRIPGPIVAALFGVLLALIPGTAEFEFPPEAILPLVLPPLLYTAAWQSSWQRFVKGWRPIVALAVALVFVTTAAVAAVASRIHPALPLGAAVVLGVICAPPDPAAITVMARRLRLPRRLVTLLEGEGLFNDVTALTLYQVAVAGVITGSLSWWSAAGSFVYSGVAGVAIGLVVAIIFNRLSNRFGGAQVRAGLSLLLPYSAYLVAEEMGASGVLAVLVAGFWISHRRRDPDEVEERLYGRSFWEVVQVLVTGFTFGLVGLEFVTVAADIGERAWGYVGSALVICVVLIVVRFAWMFGAVGLMRYRHRRVEDPEVPHGWRETVLVAWAGMRAVVTVATALALPAAFPQRSQVIFVALLVALVTLLVPGITLPWLVKRLGLNTGQEHRDAAKAQVIEAATDAVLEYLHRLRIDGEITGEQENRLAIWWRGTLVDEDDEELSTRYPQRQKLKEIHAEMLTAARAATLKMRPVEPEAADELLRDLDLRTAAA
ncbi:MAG TPA: cation:proton antiporter [Candidatus Limnocylindrales bacterium]